VQRSIPPDLTRGREQSRDGLLQHEAVGDLHLAADHFAGAVESYRAAIQSESATPADRCRLFEKLARAQLGRGEYEAARVILLQAREVARLLDDPRAAARIAAALGHLLVTTGDYRRGRRYALYAYGVLRDTDEHRLVGQLGVSLGLCETRLGRPQAAIEWLQSAAATFRRIDDADGLVSALNNLGLVYKNLREWREATRFLEQALKLDERAGLYARAVAHHQNLGLIRYRLGEWDLAEENFRNALRIAREMGHAQSESAVLLALGHLARRRRQFDRAEDHFDRALELATRSGARREVVLAREFMGELVLDRGDAVAAGRMFQAALDEAKAIAPNGDLVAELETRLGLALLRQGDVEGARGHVVRGTALAERLGDRLEVAIAERVMAQIDAACGNVAGFESRMAGASQCFEELGESYELALTLSASVDALMLMPASTRLRVPIEPMADAARRAAAIFRHFQVAPLAAQALVSLARLEAEREQYDLALSQLEQAEQWLSDCEDAEMSDRAESLRRDIERQYVAVSLSTCNEFRALEEANRLFRQTADMDGLLSQTVKLAVEHTGGDRGFVAFSSGGRLDVVAQHGLGRDRARRILRVFEGIGGVRIGENGPVFSSRVTADPRFGAHLTESLDGVGSLVCVPLNFPSQSVGLVYVDRLNDNLLGAFRQRELNLLAVLANSAAVAIVEAQRSLLLEENRQLRDRLKPSPGSDRVIFQSREMDGIMNLLNKVGDSTATILFMGETGTGMGLLAQVVHEVSKRRDKSFVQVNCAAIPEQLLESELFGYVQGAFTGAVRDKTGLFEEANGGTIFLDEIEKIPESVQAKLLHVLDRCEVRAVGATRPKRVDARVICATGCDLRDRIKEGRFLEDLFYRLNDITIRVPSLRERPEDIPILAQHFLCFYARQMEKNVQGFSPGVMNLLIRHEWRGNVRELEKTIKRLVVLVDDGGVLDPSLLPSEVREAASRVPDRGDVGTLKHNVTELERRMISETLERNRWNKARTARDLGLSYPTLLAKIRTFELEQSK
jgi:transcriptional regulator with GAF, ATPase, and Fis domain/tetratricopeptide (TPR) repeat protein